MADDKRLPVTVLSGFLGAGKTTLLKKILTNASAGEEGKNLKMAVLVNDMGEINLDADEIKDTKLIQEEAQMVELHNGCICCTLRGDLLKQVKALSDEKSFDYLVIESTGISEPLPIAQTFVMDVDEATVVPSAGQKSNARVQDHEPSQVQSLSQFARLDTMVTVVDALNIFEVLGSVSTLAEKNITGMVGNTGIKKKGKVRFPWLHAICRRLASISRSLQRENQVVDDRSIAQLMLDQVEFADVIIVSKAPLLKDKLGVIEEITALLQRLNPRAKILVPHELHFADLAVDSIIDTRRFDMEKAQSSAGWLAELEKSRSGVGHTPETEEYGVSSVLFLNNTRPFHPARLQKILAGFGNYSSSIALSGEPDNGSKKKGKEAKETGTEDATTDAMPGPFQGVVRAKGKLWVASSCSHPVMMQVAGRHVDLEARPNPFLHAVLDSEWPGQNWREFENIEKIMGQVKWFEDTGYGDSFSEAVFIGVQLDNARIKQELENALLTDEELAGGKEAWKKLEDVFFGGTFFEVKQDEPAVIWLKSFIRPPDPDKA